MSVSLFSTTTTYDLLKEEYGPFISIPQAAKIVGNHVSSWHKWLASDMMPVPTVTVGSSRRIRLIDLCTYLDANASTAGPTKPGPTKKDGTPKKKLGRPCKVDAAALVTSHA